MPLYEICPLISVVCTPLGLVHVQTRYLVQGDLEEYLPDWWIESQRFHGGCRVIIWNKKKKWDFSLLTGQAATVVYEGGYIFRHTELDSRRGPAKILQNVINGRYRITTQPGYHSGLQILPAQ